MRDKRIRAVYLRKMKSGKQYWYATLWDLSKNRWRRFPLFSQRDPRAKHPERSGVELRSAWEAVAAGGRPSKKEAWARARELVREANACLSGASGEKQLPELIAEELKHGGVKGQRAVGTRNDRRRVLLAFESYLREHYAWVLETDIREVQKVHVREYLCFREEDDGIGVTRKRIELGYIARLFNYAIEEGYLELNPTTGIRLRSPSRSERRHAVQRKYLKPEHVEAILWAARTPYTVKRKGNVFKGSVAKGREVIGQVEFEKTVTPPRYLYPLVLCMAQCGCRHGDLVEISYKDSETGEVTVSPGLLWENVDFSRRKFTVINKGKTRVVAMTPDVFDELKRLRQEQAAITGPVLRHLDGRPVKKRYDEWHRLVDRSGVPTWYEGRKRHPIPHDLRHTTATQMELDGHDPHTIQQQLGHADLTTTEIYLHRQEDSMVQAVWRQAQLKKSQKRRKEDPESGPA